MTFAIGFVNCYPSIDEMEEKLNEQLSYLEQILSQLESQDLNIKLLKLCSETFEFLNQCNGWKILSQKKEDRELREKK